MIFTSDALSLFRYLLIQCSTILPTALTQVEHRSDMKVIFLHDDVIKWKHFPCYWPFVWGIHRSPVNSRTKASDAELWCFLWSVPEPTVEQTMETPVIWDTITLIMASLQCIHPCGWALVHLLLVLCSSNIIWLIFSQIQNKIKWRLQIKKNSNFTILQKQYMRHTLWSCLIRCINMKWIQPEL